MEQVGVVWKVIEERASQVLGAGGLEELLSGLADLQETPEVFLTCQEAEDKGSQSLSCFLCLSWVLYAVSLQYLLDG